MNHSGNAILAKRRVHDEGLRADIAGMMRKAERVMSRREEMLRDSQILAHEVRAIKKRSIEDFEKRVFSAAKQIGKKGVNVFIAKKPVDVAEYIRDVIGRGRIGIVPSPQTMEAEVMQAFFMSNKACVLSDRYSGLEKGLHYIHPYFPYPLDIGASKKLTVDYAILSALAVSDNGTAYVEQDEAEALNDSKEVFVIVTADRIFKDDEADRIAELLGVASGGAIKPFKAKLRGHLIILDNGRMALARSNLKDMLMCVNCYACSLYCPIYLAVGGLFGAPMMAGIGALSIGYQSGVKAAINRGLYYCTLCGRCEKECPTEVPIMDLIQKTRKKVKISGI